MSHGHYRPWDDNPHLYKHTYCEECEKIIGEEDNPICNGHYNYLCHACANNGKVFACKFDDDDDEESDFQFDDDVPF
ncbi:hypothetical protein MOMA_07016 [Moraxella macacae 0408225]|uniref:Uncharacterized protein n=1 Tax=Moraxella macacae 0408225 TaxID=1230338 RepID=L2F758_9GAMM|nr:hypothetical protein [Moraxella macacae]ELA08293.1 hypothetical protein MOMA_07016 [Moraxella macacae 0408225]